MEKPERAVTARRTPLLLSFTALVGVWVIWLFVMGFSARLVSTHPYDFESYYAAAEALRFDHTANIYSTATLAHAAQVHGNCKPFMDFAYVYPPVLAVLLEPLTLMPCASASIVWLLINAALWAASTALLGLTLAGRWPGHRLGAITIMSVASLGFLQAYEGLFLGQAHIILLFTMALAIWLAERSRPWLAGGALILGAAIKFFPAALIVYYLARKRSGIAWGVAIVGVGAVVVMALATSPATLAQTVPAAFTSVSGQTVSGGLNESLTVTLPYAGRILALLIGLVFLLVIVRRSGDDVLGAGWASCTMLLISPLVWSFYLLWLLPTFCACLAALGPPGRGASRLRGAGWALLAALFLVIALPLSLTLRPFATLALWALTGALYWRSAADVSALVSALAVEAATTGA